MFTLLLAAGGLYYLLTRSPSIAQELPPPPTASLPDVEAVLEAKAEDFLRQVEESLASGSAQPVRIEVSDQEINALIARELPRLRQEMEEMPLEVKQVRVALGEDRVKAVAEVEIAGFTSAVAVQARVTLKAGKPRVEVERINLGGLPLPGVVKDQINDFIERATTDIELENLPIVLQQLTIQEGKLILEGTVLPQER